MSSTHSQEDFDFTKLRQWYERVKTKCNSCIKLKKQLVENVYKLVGSISRLFHNHAMREYILELQELEKELLQVVQKAKAIFLDKEFVCVSTNNHNFLAKHKFEGRRFWFPGPGHYCNKPMSDDAEIILSGHILEICQSIKANYAWK